MIGLRTELKGVSSPTLLIALLTAALAAWSPDLAFAQRLRGKVAGGQYTSARGLLTAAVPKARNAFGVPFKVEDHTETGERNHDTVVFHVQDFGEVLLASVRRIPPSVLDEMGKDDPHNVLKNLADKALGDWRQLASEPEVVEEEVVTIDAYGQAAVRVYKVAKGSLLQKAGPSSRPPESFDALIVVVAAKRHDQMISAIAQYDAGVIEAGQRRGQLSENAIRRLEEGERNRLKARLLEFFGTVVVPKGARFERR